MAHSTANTLVIGSDSLIGSALMSRLQRAGERVIGTTRRSEAVDESHLYLDLSKSMEQWRCPWPIATAVMCASVTKMEACRRDPVGTAHINVQSTCNLLRALVSTGAFVVYLSSNQVFDGTGPYRQPEEPLSPVTEYGRQKAEVERQLSKLGSRVAVVRLTKVIYSGMPLLDGWLHDLRNGKAVHPFSDMVMSPVLLDFTVEVLSRISGKCLPGILQISAERDVTYAQVANYLAERVGAEPSLVQPVQASKSPLTLESIPAYTTLDTTRLRTELGLQPPEVWPTVAATVNLSASTA